MSMWMVSEGWSVSISLPSSTMEIKWPMAGVGYRTIAFMAVWVLCERESAFAFEIAMAIYKRILVLMHQTSLGTYKHQLLQIVIV